MWTFEMRGNSFMRCKGRGEELHQGTFEEFYWTQENFLYYQGIGDQRQTIIS